MPTYEYECRQCGQKFEVFQKMTDKPLVTCQKCQGGPVMRLIGTGSGIIFKGTGFYETDYRRSSYKEAEKKEKETANDTSSKETSPKKTSAESS
ncbi:MAG: zinc ribbon domain-containing protein [Candidatus Omnitrophica bacterium]|nr:zinc ribbon domain-containing protein [Candidatus Omnitrophota bacterium]